MLCLLNYMPHLLQYCALFVSSFFFDPQIILFSCKCVTLYLLHELSSSLARIQVLEAKCKKFFAVPEQIFHEFQQGTKGRKLRLTF